MSVGSAAEIALVALVYLGALPLVVGAYQYLLVGFHVLRCHYDRTAPYSPRVAVLVPAWNEGLVIGTTIDRLLSLDYARDAIRVYVVDDASTDDTPDVIRRKGAEYPGRVVHVRREAGGQGKAHALNEAIALMLDDDWMQVLLITDADVVYARDSLRRMTRHLLDPQVGAVTGFICEGSRPGNYLNRFIAYEYVTAQAAARRAQNVIGAMACLAGGMQLHSRENLEAIGGRIDTTSLAEDTFTTFGTQLHGRRAIFDGNAVCYAEEPHSIVGLWKQRLRWARGNVQVTFRFRRLWFRSARQHRLGRIDFGLIWFVTFLQPVLMIVASAALVALFFSNFDTAWNAFRYLWIASGLSFMFMTVFALLIEPGVARRSWFEAITFPGLIALFAIVYSCFPFVFEEFFPRSTVERFATSVLGTTLVLLLYTWPAASMLLAYLAKVLESTRIRWLCPLLVYLVGFGPLLCAITFTAYVYEARRADMTWDKTEKTGEVGA